jgi:hypothetical protein
LRDANQFIRRLERLEKITGGIESHGRNVAERDRGAILALLDMPLG